MVSGFIDLLLLQNLELDLGPHMLGQHTAAELCSQASFYLFKIVFPLPAFEGSSCYVAQADLALTVQPRQAMSL